MTEQPSSSGSGIESFASGAVLIDEQPLEDVIREIAQGVRSNSAQLGHLEKELSKTNEKLEHLEREQEKSNIIVETYQKASGQVVNLAFGLIATATITIILSSVLGK